jgi:ankyrin repeat protein
MKKGMLAVLLLVAAQDLASADSREDQLLEAVRAGDVAATKALLDQGVPVDAKFRYDRTPLSFAADRGNVEMVKLLLERGANVDAEDTFYHNTPLGSAAYKGHAEVVRLLLARSTKGAGDAFLSGVYGKKPDVVQAVVATGKISARDLSYGLQAAEQSSATEVADVLRKLGAVPPPKADATVDPAVLARYAGTYRQEDGSEEFTLAVAEGGLTATFSGRTFKLGAIDAQHFQQLEAAGVTLAMQVTGDRVTGATVNEIGSERRYRRVEEAKP